MDQRTRPSEQRFGMARSWLLLHRTPLWHHTGLWVGGGWIFIYLLLAPHAAAAGPAAGASAPNVASVPAKTAGNPAPAAAKNAGGPDKEAPKVDHALPPPVIQPAVPPHPAAPQPQKNPAPAIAPPAAQAAAPAAAKNVGDPDKQAPRPSGVPAQPAPVAKPAPQAAIVPPAAKPVGVPAQPAAPQVDRAAPAPAVQGAAKPAPPAAKPAPHADDPDKQAPKVDRLAPAALAQGAAKPAPLAPRAAAPPAAKPAIVPSPSATGSIASVGQGTRKTAAKTDPAPSVLVADHRADAEESMTAPTAEDTRQPKQDRSDNRSEQRAGRTAPDAAQPATSPITPTTVAPVQVAATQPATKTAPLGVHSLSAMGTDLSLSGSNAAALPPPPPAFPVLPPPVSPILHVGSTPSLAEGGVLVPAPLPVSRIEENPPFVSPVVLHNDISPAPVPAPASSTAPAAAVTSNASGQPMPVGDLPGWHQVFAEDFATPVPLGSFPGSVYSGRWGVYQDGWTDNPGDGVYMPSRVDSVAGGALDYWFHTENGQHLIAASVPLLPGGQDQLYGRYAVRFRVDPIPGYKMSFLLWPQSETWPRDGEIDFPEGDFTGRFSAYTHHQGATSGGDQDAFETGPMNDGGWHTAVTEWTPTAVRYTLDGALIGVSTASIPNTPMHWVLQTGRIAGEPVADTVAGHMQIDWATVYAPG